MNELLDYLLRKQKLNSSEQAELVKLLIKLSAGGVK